MLLSCLAGITVADGQCSQSDFVQFNGCMKDSVNALLQGDAGSTGDMTGRISECFVNSDCNPPDLSESADNGFGESLTSLFGDTSPDQLSTSFLQVADNVSSKVDECVREKTPFTNFVSIRASEFKNLNLHTLMGGKNSQLMRIVDSMSKCSTADEKLFKCLKGIAVDSGVNNKFNQFCNQSAVCVNKLPCNATLVRHAVCSCVGSHLNSTTTYGSSNIRNYEDQLFASLGKRAPNSRARLAMGPFIRRVVEQICTADPCNDYKKTSNSNRNGYQTINMP
jgi:hypothetical protein